MLPPVVAAFSTAPSHLVRANALIGVVSYGSPQAASARGAIDAMAEFGLDEEKLALARAIRYSPGAAYETILLRLADTENTRVKRAVALAMREILSYRFIPSLLKMLPHRSVRAQARSTLVAMGTPILVKLDEALDAQDMDKDVRRQIPRVISELPPRAAAAEHK